MTAHKRRWSFSLRTLFVVVTAFALLGVPMRAYLNYCERERVFEEVTRWNHKPIKSKLIHRLWR